jgi:hypothetical protein
VRELQINDRMCECAIPGTTLSLLDRLFKLVIQPAVSRGEVPGSEHRHAQRVQQQQSVLPPEDLPVPPTSLRSALTLQQIDRLSLSVSVTHGAGLPTLSGQQVPKTSVPLVYEQ